MGHRVGNGNRAGYGMGNRVGNGMSNDRVGSTDNVWV